MSFSLDQLKAAFKKEENKQSRPNNYYPFWEMKVGEQAIVRFLPDANEDNPLGFMVEKFMHTLTINGEKKSVPCLKNYDEDCPICKVSAGFYKEEDKVNGKKYWRKKQNIVQALIIEDPLAPNADTGETHEGKVRFLALGYQLFTVIKEAFESGELDEVPFAYKGGCNFIIKKTKQGDYDTYAVGSKFARKSSDLTDDEIAYVEDNIIDLSTLLPAHPGTEKVEGMLYAAMNGEEYEDSGSNSSSNSGSSSSTQIEDSKPTEDSKTTSATESGSDDDNDYDDEAAKLIAQIKARRANK